MYIEYIGAGFDRAPSWDAYDEIAMPAPKRRRILDPSFDPFLASACFPMFEPMLPMESMAAADPITPLTRLTALPSEVLYVVASNVTLYDYLSLAQVDRATWSGCAASPGWVGQFADSVRSIKGGPDIVAATRRILLYPATWQPTLMRFLALRASRVDLRDINLLHAMWMARIKAMHRLSRSFFESTRYIALRDLIITEMYQPQLGEAASDRTISKRSTAQMSALPLRYWPPIFEAHPDLFSYKHPITKCFAHGYDDRLHRFSPTVVEKMMTSLYFHRKVENISAQLTKWFPMTDEARLNDLDTKMAALIVDDEPCSYSAFVRQCVRWRPGDGAFRTLAEQALVRRRSHMVLLDQRVEKLDKVRTAPMREPIRHFILTAEHDTADALNRDPKQVGLFLNLCERVSVFNSIDSLGALIDVVASAPLQMQPVLFHRLANLFAQANDRRETLDAAEKVRLDITIGSFFSAFENVVLRRAWMYATALQPRIAVVHLVCSTILKRGQSGPGTAQLERFLNSILDGTRPKDWSLFLTSLVKLPRSLFGEGDKAFIPKVLSDEKVAVFLNRFLRAPDARFTTMDPPVFELMKPAILAAFDSLPDAADNPTQRMAALSSRLGLSVKQRSDLRKHLLNDQVLAVCANAITIEGALQRFGLTDPEDRAHIERKVWDALVRPQLVVSPVITGWVYDLVTASDFLTEKAAIFLRPLFGPSQSLGKKPCA